MIHHRRRVIHTRFNKGVNLDISCHIVSSIMLPKCFTKHTSIHTSQLGHTLFTLMASLNIKYPIPTHDNPSLPIASSLHPEPPPCLSASQPEPPERRESPLRTRAPTVPGSPHSATAQPITVVAAGRRFWARL